MTQTFVELGYLISIILFIVGLKYLSHPSTARKGNLTAATGMGFAILITLFYPIEGAPNNYLIIFAGIIIGGLIGFFAARKIKMTAMPEMVSLFNGLGGACALLISFSEIYNYPQSVDLLSAQVITALFTLFIGSISFTGSLVAYGKLQGFLRDALKLPFPQVVNIILLVAAVSVAAWFCSQGSVEINIVLILVALSLVYGVTFVSPIGGGDMPVVISLLNSFTGLGAGLAGIIYNNQVMLVGGIIVGASGTILTILMCKAMNRSLINVIIGSLSGSGGSSDTDREHVIKEATITDTAVLLKYAERAIVVPGYGLAVAQAQHVVHELEEKLAVEGVEVKYAIHPVAGRMPGHMNVLLAEADVPYEKLLEIEDANKEFDNTDVVVIVGANDVVNPAANEDKGSPIYGMPILEVERAQNVVVLKRSMSTGYSGIQNYLFYGDKTKMLFGDAKQSLTKLVEEVDNV